MDLDEHVAGAAIAFMIAYGALTLLARISGWRWMLSKRAVFQHLLGRGFGDVIHFIAYTFFPLAGGLLALFIFAALPA